MDDQSTDMRPQDANPKMKGSSEATAAPASSLMSIRIRRANPHTQRPAEAPAAEAQAQAPAAPRPAAQQRPPQARRPQVQRTATARTAAPKSLLSYWLDQRRGRVFPMLDDLDGDKIEAHWPNSILLRCRGSGGGLEPQRMYINALGNGSDGRGVHKIELSSMMLQWLIGLAGAAVRDRRPMEDREVFPGGGSSQRYHAYALPLSADQRTVDHVLCHIDLLEAER